LTAKDTKSTAHILSSFSSVQRLIIPVTLWMVEDKTLIVCSLAREEIKLLVHAAGF